MDVWEVLRQWCDYIVNKWEGGREGILLLNLFIICVLIRDIRSGYDKVYVPTYIAVYCVQQNIRIYV